MNSNNSDARDVFGPRSTRVDSFYANRLIETLAPHVTFREYPVGHRIVFSAASQSDVYIFRAGAISVYRQPDDILLDLLEAPTLRGIIPVHSSSQSEYVIRTISPAEMAFLDNAKFYALISELQLWEDFARHLQLVSGMAAEILYKVISPLVFDIVRLQLYELMEKPEHVRENITVENYVRGKTRVSRSAIMRVLSELKNGGYIIIENGILKSINHIPKKY